MGGQHGAGVRGRATGVGWAGATAGRAPAAHRSRCAPPEPVRPAGAPRPAGGPSPYGRRWKRRSQTRLEIADRASMRPDPSRMKRKVPAGESKASR